jgi:hypothetical protein
MKPVGGSRHLFIAQAGVRHDVRKMFERMNDELGGAVFRYTINGKIPAQREQDVLTSAARIVDRYFVGSDGRHPYDKDGVTPLAEYPRILNKWLVTVTQQVVYSQRDWMRHNIPDDVYRFLHTVKSKSVKETFPQASVLAEADPKDYKELGKAFKIVHQNPLATYDAPHSWVDPNGYRLSDRIWQTDVTTRIKLDRFLTDTIRTGMDSTTLAQQLENYLLPGRTLRTKKPYGRDASYDAMRLARTEISHAHAEATLASGLANPYVDGADVARSGAGDPNCPICPEHATIDIDGARLREPYDIERLDPPPYHPHDMCCVICTVSKSASDVTADLRSFMQQAREEHLEPYLTPAQADDFIKELLGNLIDGYLTPQRYLE